MTMQTCKTRDASFVQHLPRIGPHIQYKPCTGLPSIVHAHSSCTNRRGRSLIVASPSPFRAIRDPVVGLIRTPQESFEPQGALPIGPDAKPVPATQHATGQLQTVALGLHARCGPPSAIGHSCAWRAGPSRRPSRLSSSARLESSCDSVEAYGRVVCGIRR